MKLQTIFRLLTIATGLLGGSFTHPAIAKRCCDSEAVATLGASAQIAHSIPPQQTSPIVLATAYTDLTLPTLRPGDRGRDVQCYSAFFKTMAF